MEELASDWFSSFLDLTDVQLLDACSRWLESEDGRKWPTKFDLREVLKAAKSHALQSTLAGCDVCDQTGWRELVRIDANDQRERHVAPCSCPKGHHFANPPPWPANYTGPKWPKPEPWDVVVQAWERKGYQVLVSSAEEPHFPLSYLDPSEATADRLARAKEHRTELEAVVGKLVNKFKMDPDDKRTDRKTKAAGDWNDEDTTVIPAPEAP